MRKWIPAVIAGLVLTAVTGCTPQPIQTVATASESAKVPPIVIQAGQVPEQANPQESLIVAWVYSEALNAAGIRTQVVSTDAVRSDYLKKLQNGSVDLVPEYSSDLLHALDPNIVPTSAATVLKAVATELPAKLSLLSPTNAQDDDSIVVTQVTAQKYGLTTLSDLAKVCSKITLAAPSDFKTAGDGLPGLKTTYGCVPGKVSVLPYTDQDLLLALLRNDVQVADIHTSSPSVPDNALVALTDTKNLFYPEQMVPLVNTSKVPEDAQKIINQVSGLITTADLINLNRLVVGVHHASPQEVALSWLQFKGLVKQPK